MRRMPVRSVAVFLVGVLTTLWAVRPQPTHAQEPPIRVIFVVGDGAGVSYWTAAAFAVEQLAMERFPVMGLVDTRPSDNKVTRIRRVDKPFQHSLEGVQTVKRLLFC